MSSEASEENKNAIKFEFPHPKIGGTVSIKEPDVDRYKT